MTFVVRGLREVQDNIYQAANLIRNNPPAIQETLWSMGLELRNQCQIMCDQVVYSTPESPKYRRTGYLRATIYVTMVGRTNWREAHAAGYALAQATYPNRQSNFRTYALGRPIARPPGRGEVKVTAGARYADWVEFGDGNNNAGPRPFMRQGSEAGARAVFSVAENGIRRALSAVARGQARNRLGQFTRR